MRNMIWLFTLVLCTASATLAQVPAKTPKAPQSTITGKITIKDKPAPGVRVMMRRSDVFSSQYEDLPKGITAEDGSFRLSGVPAGSFNIIPSVPAYVLSDQRDRTVVVTEGETIENINFSMVKGGVVTGKVLDAEGRPVIAQSVNLYRADAWDRQQPIPRIQPQASGAAALRPRPVMPITAATTDDRGVYRIFGIAAGKYKVAVGRGEEGGRFAAVPGRTTFKQVFYPDTADQSKATIIEVSEGSEATNIDVKLGAAIQTYTASGRVIEGENGAPIAGARFTLQRITNTDLPEIVPSNASTTPKGEFVLEGLLAGTYSAFVVQNNPSDLRAEGLTFEIVDQDLSGLTIKMVRGSSISGVVVNDPDDKKITTQLSSRLVYVGVQGPNPISVLGQSGTSKINPDGSFKVTGLPAGLATLYISNPQGDINNQGFVLMRVEREGTPLPRNFEIKDGESLTGVRVIVSFGSATLRGQIRLNVPFPENATFSVRLNRNGELFSNMRPFRVDARGKFVLEGMPPGPYEIVASVTSATLRTLKPTSQQVVLTDNTVTDVEVLVDVTSTPRP